MSGCLESGIACISDEPANSLREHAQNMKRSARSLIKRPRTFQGGFYSSSRFHDTQTKFKYELRRKLLIPNSDLGSEQESVHDPSNLQKTILYHVLCCLDLCRMMSTLYIGPTQQ
jgi:hypothetical protein